MNDLIIAQNETAYTTSNMMAEKFGKKHKHILDSIDRTVKDLTAVNSAVKSFFVESTHVNERNREYRNYLLTRDGFTLVAMGLNGKKAMKFKIQYIAAFNAMEDRLKRQAYSRLRGIEARKELTDHVKDSGENERMHGHGYSNYTKLAYKTIGIAYKKPPKGVDFRDGLTSDELKRLKNVESLIKGALEAGSQYNEVKEMLGNMFDNQKQIKE